MGGERQNSRLAPGVIPSIPVLLWGGKMKEALLSL